MGRGRHGPTSANNKKRMFNGVLCVKDHFHLCTRCEMYFPVSGRNRIESHLESCTGRDLQPFADPSVINHPHNERNEIDDIHRGGISKPPPSPERPQNPEDAGVCSYFHHGLDAKEASAEEPARTCEEGLDAAASSQDESYVHIGAVALPMSDSVQAATLAASVAVFTSLFAAQEDKHCPAVEAEEEAMEDELDCGDTAGCSTFLGYAEQWMQTPDPPYTMQCPVSWTRVTPSSLSLLETPEEFNCRGSINEFLFSYRQLLDAYDQCQSG